MKNLLFAILFLIILSGQAICKEYFYFSPGITFGWNIGNGFNFTPKLSLGWVNTNLEIYNITYSYNFHTEKKDPQFDYKDYHSFELQMGSVRYCVGGGAGFAIIDDKKSLQIAPKITLFAGAGLYANMDMLLVNRKLNTNLGVQVVLPISGPDSPSIGRY